MFFREALNQKAYLLTSWKHTPKTSGMMKRNKA